MSEEEIRHHLLCPSGRFAVQTLTFAVTAASIDEIDKDGWVDDWSHGNSPETQLYVMNDGQQIVMDGAGGEWLTRHCRIVSGNFEADEYDEEIISPWPENIQVDCRRVKELHDVVRQLTILNNIAPADFRDTTTKVVLDEVVVKRCTTEIATLQARIDEFRATDPRVVLPDEEEEEVDASV